MELIQIKGIGEQRAKALQYCGIDTVEQLSLLTPEELDKIIPSSNSQWIESAKKLVNKENRHQKRFLGVKAFCPSCSSSNLKKRAEAIEPRLHLRCLDCGKAFVVNKYSGEPMR